MNKEEKQYERAKLWSLLDRAISKGKTAEWITNQIQPMFFLWRDVEIERLEKEIVRLQDLALDNARRAG